MSNLRYPAQSSVWNAPMLLALLAGCLAGLAGTATAQAILPAAEGDELFTSDRIPRLEITIPEAGLETLRQYNWRESRESNPREDVRAAVREGNRVYTNVAIHLKGSAGSFRSIDSPKPALTLNFDKFAKGQRFHGLQKLHLNNSMQDQSFVSEIVCRELFLKAGIPAPRASHAVVDLNGRGSQLYVLVEGWNKQFLKRHFRNADGNLYDGGAARDINVAIEVQSGKNPEDRSRLDELLAATRETNITARSQRLAGVLDIDQFLSFTAMELLTVHWDGYARNRNNYRIFHNLDSDRLVFLPHGMDQMFGRPRSTPQDSLTPMVKGVVARAALGDPALRRRYIHRAAVLFSNVFDYAAITTRVHHLSRRIQPHLLPDLDALANQDLAAARFLDRIEQRIESVRDQLRDELAEAQPLQFGADNTVALKRWVESVEAGNPGFERSAGAMPWLRISAANGVSYGSWRMKVLLDGGRYRLAGRVRTDRLNTNGIPRGGVSLRISGDRDATMLAAAPEWTALSHEFHVAGLLDTELVCEFRAARGTAWFDLTSLKLIRLPSGDGPAAR